MAASTAQSSTTSPASQSSCLEGLDLECYINYDQTLFPSSTSISPSSTRSKSILSSHSSLGSSNNTLLPSQPSGQQVFAGPSHQYELHKQQAGLPVGALANTLAVNQADSLSFSRGQQYYGVSPVDGYFGMNTTDDYLDFGTAPTLNPALGANSDMDLDFGSPVHDMFLQSIDSSSTDYVDPAAIGGQEDLLTPIQPLQGSTARVWPGIHQQQAAIAKAQAEQQKQQALAQQSQKLTSQPSRRSNGSTSRPPTDPIVEERISRLLNQMRHSSVASSNDDERATPLANGGSSHSARIRKEEEDMDEDERLLASEEGKKLSSKERRQLRNKVSARAFRSRRKGKHFVVLL